MYVYCDKCGAKLVDGVCPECVPEQEKDKRFCGCQR